MMDEPTLITCPECGRQRPRASHSSLGEGCPYCLLNFVLGDDALLDPSTTPAATLPGRVGPYVLMGPLGEGGMGTVFQARHESLNRVVALKLLRPEFAQRPGFPERFQREGQVLANLSHPHIVGIYDMACDDGLYYLAMEYVEGSTLRDRLCTGPLAVPLAIRWFSQICAALQFAHDRGVVHCDIKPENVLIDRQEQVKVADFGIARLLGDEAPRTSSRTDLGTVAGTRGYMAPEQLEPGHEIDSRTDIYALGVLLYEMLTRELPLGVFDPPSRKGAIDPRLDKPILKALAKNAEDRPPDVRTFQRIVEQAWKPPATRRRIAVALAVGAAICLAGVMWSREAGTRPQAETNVSANSAAAAMPGCTVFSHGSRVWDAAIAPHEAMLATAGEDGLVKFWNPSGGPPRFSLRAYPHGELGYVRLAFSAREPLLATAGGEGLVRLWKLTGGKDVVAAEPQLLKGHGREIVALAFSPDGKLLATGGHDRSVKLWDPSDGRCVSTLATLNDPVLCLAFSPDGATLAAGVMNGAIKRWSTSTFEPVAGQFGHSKRVWSLAFSQRGDLLVSGSHDRTVKIWDLARRAERQTLSVEEAEVWSIAVHADRNLLAAGMHDGTIRFWQLTDGKPLRTIKPHTAAVVALSFSPDGGRLISASLDQTAVLCETEVVLAVSQPK
jgi:serine/threonine protein kinase